MQIRWTATKILLHVRTAPYGHRILQINTPDWAQLIVALAPVAPEVDANKFCDFLAASLRWKNRKPDLLAAAARKMLPENSTSADICPAYMDIQI